MFIGMQNFPAIRTDKVEVPGISGKQNTFVTASADAAHVAYK